MIDTKYVDDTSTTLFELSVEIRGMWYVLVSYDVLLLLFLM